MAKGMNVDCKRFPIRDASVPTRLEMRRILDAIDDALARGIPTYLHCWGGHGRTSTVVACYLIRHGYSPDEAIESIMRSRASLPENHYPYEGSQKEFVLSWALENRTDTGVSNQCDVKTDLAASDRSVDHYVGCLLGGAVGDALGAPIEFMGLREIRHKFGSKGITAFVAGRNPAGSITDDTQMTMFTAEGLLRAYSRWMTKGICSAVTVVHHAYIRWLSTQGERSASERQGDSYDGWLISLPELHARRAPGNTCLSALMGDEMGTIDQPINNSKGCGGVMRAAPAGLAWFSSDPFRSGCEIAAITHGHPSGYLAAGCLAMIIAELLKATALEEAIAKTIGVLKSWPHHGECLKAIELALSLSKRVSPSAEAIERIGGGWIGEEAIAISIYCALAAEGNFARAVCLAVNHSGDSDSTGAITGNIVGAMLGSRAIDEAWLSSLELRHEIEALAKDLYTGFIDDDDAWFERYPGW